MASFDPTGLGSMSRLSKTNTRTVTRSTTCGDLSTTDRTPREPQARAYAADDHESLDELLETIQAEVLDDHLNALDWQS